MSPKGRTPDGRFADGNPGGPGNPFARRVAALRALIMDAVSDEDLRAIVQAMVERAKSGDMGAARELLTRLVGKSLEAPDPDRLDVEEGKLKSKAGTANLAALQKPETAAESARVHASRRIATFAVVGHDFESGSQTVLSLQDVAAGPTRGPRTLRGRMTGFAVRASEACQFPRSVRSI